MDAESSIHDNLLILSMQKKFKWAQDRQDSWGLKGLNEFNESIMDPKFQMDHCPVIIIIVMSFDCCCSLCQKVIHANWLGVCIQRVEKFNPIVHQLQCDFLPLILSHGSYECITKWRSDTMMIWSIN